MIISLPYVGMLWLLNSTNAVPDPKVVESQETKWQLRSLMFPALLPTRSSAQVLNQAFHRDHTSYPNSWAAGGDLLQVGSVGLKGVPCCGPGAPPTLLLFGPGVPLLLFPCLKPPQPVPAVPVLKSVLPEMLPGWCWAQLCPAAGPLEPAMSYKGQP